ncbi:hypothetical protein BB561_002580 [Smittium simulii]|uniref:Transmembrane protein 198 n=1 Tax=Smittium simulii TaxID=133385 RepID=A0A2T9YPV4_9FUNG|nr:hypothetical protein BB561_002580 [Smittium simulii]
MAAVLGARLAEKSATENVPNSGNITVAGATAGCVLMIVGALIAFFGKKLYKIALFIAGFLFVSIAVLIILYQIREPEQLNAARSLLYLVCSGVFGIFGGILSMWVIKLGIFLIGALSGFTISSYILTWSSVGLFREQWVQILFCVIFGIGLGLLALIFEKYIILIGTSLFGTYSLYVGIDCFALTGFKEAVFSVFSNVIRMSDQGGKIYGMLSGASATAIISIIVQFATNKQIYN